MEKDLDLTLDIPQCNFTSANLTRSNDSYDVQTAIILRAIGVFSFVINMFTFVYIIRVCKKQKRQNSFTIQLAFVCANDVGCGMIIMFLSIPVTDTITFYLCGLSFVILNVLICMAQGNIFFISLQRYIFARNIRATTIKWKATLSNALIAVNGIVGIVVLIIDLSASPFYTAYRGKECTMAVFVDFGKQTMLTLFFFGLPTMLVSNIFCFLSIRRLSSYSAVAPALAGVSGSGSTDQENNTDGGSVNFKKNQKRAIVTVILILISFNFSTLPTFIRIFLGFFNVSFGLSINRLLLFSIFCNSLANPLIYISRMHSMRTMVVNDVTRLKQFVKKERNNA